MTSSDRDVNREMVVRPRQRFLCYDRKDVIPPHYVVMVRELTDSGNVSAWTIRGVPNPSEKEATAHYKSVKADVGYNGIVGAVLARVDEYHPYTPPGDTVERCYCDGMVITARYDPSFRTKLNLSGSWAWDMPGLRLAVNGAMHEYIKAVGIEEVKNATGDPEEEDTPKPKADESKPKAKRVRKPKSKKDTGNGHTSGEHLPPIPHPSEV